MCSIYCLTFILLSILITSNTFGEIEASPLKTFNNNVTQNSTSLLDLESLCPKPSWLLSLLLKERNNDSSTNNNSEELECFGNSGKCSENTNSEFIGFRFSELEWLNDSRSKECNYYNLISENVSNIIEKQNVNYQLGNETFVQVAFQQITGEECALIVQQYRLIEFDNGNNCSFGSHLNLTTFLNPPYCFSYDCIQKSNILTKLLTMKKSAELETEPLVIAAETKTSEVRRVERPEWVRRIRKPINWNWRDHVLEITIMFIIVAILLLIGLKICLSEKVIDYQNSRIIESKKPGVKFSRCSLNSNPPPPPRSLTYDLNKHPHKPILKNWTNKNKQTVRPFDNRLIMSREIQSFESNSSIYYDTLEYPESPESQSTTSTEGYAQPLISNF